MEEEKKEKKKWWVWLIPFFGIFGALGFKQGYEAAKEGKPLIDWKDKSNKIALIIVFVIIIVVVVCCLAIEFFY
ncbi:MAG: hypothetical protein NZ942_03895 [Candidatus Aenigmarchaeota archaeon]|nr:hypothetical protein [Candidatus Aenigmarchaeota archaeon]